MDLSEPAPAPASTSAASAMPGGSFGEDMDELLEMVLLQALSRSVKDADLPLNSSVLWNQHMLPVVPVGSALDAKRSKHKKLGKFLQAFAKVSPNFLTVSARTLFAGP